MNRRPGTAPGDGPTAFMTGQTKGQRAIMTPGPAAATTGPGQGHGNGLKWHPSGPGRQDSVRSSHRDDPPAGARPDLPPGHGVPYGDYLLPRGLTFMPVETPRPFRRHGPSMLPATRFPSRKSLAKCLFSMPGCPRGHRSDRLDVGRNGSRLNFTHRDSGYADMCKIKPF